MTRPRAAELPVDEAAGALARPVANRAAERRGSPQPRRPSHLIGAGGVQPLVGVQEEDPVAVRERPRRGRSGRPEALPRERHPSNAEAAAHVRRAIGGAGVHCHHFITRGAEIREAPPQGVDVVPVDDEAPNPHEGGTEPRGDDETQGPRVKNHGRAWLGVHALAPRASRQANGCTAAR